MASKDPVIIFDTTLRDAEQTPGATLTVREKLEIAHQLAKLKVDVIEAGFPISSEEDFQAVSRIAKEVEGPVICALARALPKDIDRAAEALRDGRRVRLHPFIGTSPQHIAMLRKNADEVFQMAVASVARAKSFCEDVEFSHMDATRSDENFLFNVVDAAIKAGATTINIPDTVGYAVPLQFGNLIWRIVQWIKMNSKENHYHHSVVISVHCHDDLGLAASNTLAALKNGARQAECTLNGLGERAGNASLEEVVMALRTRQDFFGLSCGVDNLLLVPTSQMVSRLMGITVQPNKAIVGANAFAHSSGIHQDGVLKARTTFEIMRPEDVGWGTEGTRIVLTARSGRHAVQDRLAKLGYKLEKGSDELDRTYERFLMVADKKKEVYDEDLVAIVSDEIRDIPEKYHLEYLQVVSGTSTIPSATVRLRIDGSFQEIQESAWGDGPVNAAYRAIDKAAGVSAKLEEYAIRAITSGAEAMGEVTVSLSQNGHRATGRGASTDIIEASVKAYLDALNRLSFLEQNGGQVSTAWPNGNGQAEAPLAESSAAPAT